MFRIQQRIVRDAGDSYWRYVRDVHERPIELNTQDEADEAVKTLQRAYPSGEFVVEER